MRWCARTDRHVSPDQLKEPRSHRLLPENEGRLLPLPRRIHAGQEVGDRGCQRLVQYCIDRGWEAEDDPPNQTWTGAQLLSLLLRNSPPARPRLLASEEGFWQRHPGVGNPGGGWVQRLSYYNATAQRQPDPMDQWSCRGSRWRQHAGGNVNKQKLKTVRLWVYVWFELSLNNYGLVPLHSKTQDTKWLVFDNLFILLPLLRHHHRHLLA